MKVTTDKTMCKLLRDARFAVNKANNALRSALREKERADKALADSLLNEREFTNDNYDTDAPWVFIDQFHITEQIKRVRQGLERTDGEIFSTQRCTDWLDLNRDEMMPILDAEWRAILDAEWRAKHDT